MSVIIIGGGKEARQAVDDLEAASLGMTPEQRAHAESLLRIHARQVRDYIRSCGIAAGA